MICVVFMGIKPSHSCKTVDRSASAKGLLGRNNKTFIGLHHPSVPASMQSQSLPHSRRHSEPKIYPGSPPESPGQPRNSHTTHTEKRKRTLKPVRTCQKQVQIMGEHQKPICQTLDRWKPIPSHTNTHQHRHCSHPQSQPGHPSAHLECPQRYHRICPIQAPQTQHTGKKIRMRGPHLSQYKNIYTMYKVN